MSLMIVFKLLGSLALLMFGMKSMSEALQKMAGPQLRHVLGAMTTNRFTGALTGMFVTAAVQSSTATTLMTVSFVNAGLLTLVQAISVIMGAHIGTTMTAWIMSLGMGFNITDFVYPAFFMGIILIYMKKRRIVGDFLFGVAFLFLGLGTLKETGFALVEDPASKEAISAFFAEYSSGGFFVNLLFLLMGTILTLCVQSSAAIMAITMMLCSTGVLHIDQGVMLVLGENIGTTITSNIVALSANTQARRAAFAHLTTNVLGVCWVLILLKPFFALVCPFRLRANYDARRSRLRYQGKCGACNLPLGLQYQQHSLTHLVHSADREVRMLGNQAKEFERRGRLPPTFHYSWYHEDARTVCIGSTQGDIILQRTHSTHVRHGV